jgi:hypothetical protein
MVIPKCRVLDCASPLALSLARTPAHWNVRWDVRSVARSGCNGGTQTITFAAGLSGHSCCPTKQLHWSWTGEVWQVSTS